MVTAMRATFAKCKAQAMRVVRVEGNFQTVVAKRVPPFAHA